MSDRKSIDSYDKDQSKIEIDKRNCDPESFVRKAWEDILNKTSSAPVKDGEGYFQVLKRMDSYKRFPDELIVLEAHRVRQLNNNRDKLYSGERFPLESQQQREIRLKEALEKFKALGCGTIPNTVKIPPETPPVWRPGQPPLKLPGGGPILPPYRPGGENIIIYRCPKEPHKPEPNPAHCPPYKPGGPEVETKPKPKPKPEPTEEEKRRNAMLEKAAEIRREHEKNKLAFEESLNKQGAFGSFYNGLKNNIGLSYDNTWLPLRPWAYMFDKDSGSDQLRKQIVQEDEQVKRLEDAARTGDQRRFTEAMNNLPRKDGKLESVNVVNKFDSSQRNGVDTITDIGTIAIASTVVRNVHGASLGKPAELVSASLLSSVVGKNALMQLDGKYADFWHDTATGAMLGLAVPLGEMAGAKLTQKFAPKIQGGLPTVGEGIFTRVDTLGQSELTKWVGAGLRYGSAGAIVNGSLSFGKTIVDNGSNTSLGDLALNTVTGAAIGAFVGTGVGRIFDTSVNTSRLKVSDEAKAIKPIDNVASVDSSAPKSIKIKDIRPTEASSSSATAGAASKELAGAAPGVLSSEASGVSSVESRLVTNPARSAAADTLPKTADEIAKAIESLPAKHKQDLTALYSLPRTYKLVDSNIKDSFEAFKAIAESTLSKRAAITGETVNAATIEQEVFRIMKLNTHHDKSINAGPNKSWLVDKRELRLYTPESLKEFSEKLLTNNPYTIDGYLKVKHGLTDEQMAKLQKYKVDSESWYQQEVAKDKYTGFTPIKELWEAMYLPTINMVPKDSVWAARDLFANTKTSLEAVRAKFFEQLNKTPHLPNGEINASITGHSKKQ